jgi:uncharacterized protein YcaQ
MVLELTRAQARQIAVRAQWLGEPRPTDVLEVVRHLTFLQAEPTAAVAPSADLVLWSRIGSAYDRAELRDAVDELALVDLDGLLRPTEDVALFRAEMEAWPGPEPREPWQEQLAAWVDANEVCRLDLLERLRQEGPLPASALPDTCEVPWRSSGWNDARNVQRLLAQMAGRGEVAVAGREGRERLWDLAERVYPDGPFPDLEEAVRLRAERRLSALGIARAKAPRTPNEPDHVGTVGVEARVEGVRGTWRVDPAYVDGGSGREFAPRAALLSPFDRLVFDRRRLGELFGFDYVLEMYKPVAERRWGYYALPVLVGDRLIGKLDATAEPAEGVLRVDALHEDEPLAGVERDLVEAEIEDLARWLGLEVMRVG